MSDRMRMQSFENILESALSEFENVNSIFSIPASGFHKRNAGTWPLLGQNLDTPIGPAAGPHTQLCRNIVSAFLAGCSFFELKTVQRMDELEFEKPCIDALDEGYNTEWSQELSLEDSCEEYLKAWVLIHVLNNRLRLGGGRDGVHFNMSVGYDLEGLKSGCMERFMESMINPDARIGEWASAAARRLGIEVDIPMPRFSATISTMHGCPPSQIRAMAEYLIGEKHLDTFVKLNPTLLGRKRATAILERCGYGYLEMGEGVFEKDLQYGDGVDLIKKVSEYARSRSRRFGIKLSNTLACRNTGPLPGDERYMSGRALFPLTVTLASLIAREFDGKLNISYCGGASIHSVHRLLEAGVFPVTFATEILKPGGYLRLSSMAGSIDGDPVRSGIRLDDGSVDHAKLADIAREALDDPWYRKSRGRTAPLKISPHLQAFDCVAAPCVHRCPIHQDIPSYIEKVREGDYTGALRIIMRKNPLPAVTGYICDHPCLAGCVRGDYDNPVGIRELKRIAEELGDREAVVREMKEEIAGKKNNVSVGIVGAGPAGLAAGFYLLREGFGVTLYDRGKLPGGLVRDVLPGFRIRDEAVARDARTVEELGAEFRLEWGEALTAEALAEKYDYVIIATGSSVPRELGLKGETLAGCYNAIDFLRGLREGGPLVGDACTGEKVLVIGGGNSAVDAARGALRFTPDVTIVYRRDIKSMPADREELDFFHEEGGTILEWRVPVGIEGGGRVTGLEVLQTVPNGIDGSGRPRPVPVENSETLLEAGTVITAVGETVDVHADILRTVPLDERGRVIVNPGTGETGVHRVFAAGDCVRGPATVVEAVADAKRAARAIIHREKVRAPGLDDHYYRPEAVRAIEGRGKVVFGELLEGERVLIDNSGDGGNNKGFRPVIRTLEPGEAADEGERCLGCDGSCSRCVDVCPNRANHPLDFEPVSLRVPVLEREKSGKWTTSYRTLNIEQKTQILHLDDWCNECGNCATFCLHEGMPYRDKLTLFMHGDLFDESENSGFHPLATEGGEKYLCRADGTVFTMISEDRKKLVFESDGFRIELDPDRDFELLSFSISGDPGSMQRIDTAPLVEVFLMARAARNAVPGLIF